MLRKVAKLGEAERCQPEQHRTEPGGNAATHPLHRVAASASVLADELLGSAR